MSKNKETQRLYFYFTDTGVVILLLLKYEISSSKPSTMILQAGLCQNLSKFTKNGLLTSYFKLSGLDLSESSSCDPGTVSIIVE